MANTSMPDILKHEEDPRYLPSLYLPNGKVSPQSIRYYRHMHGFSQESFAEFIGVHPYTVKNWERGIHQPGGERVVILDRVVKYTRQQMERHDGYLPDAKKLKRHTDWQQWATDPVMLEVFAMTDTQVARLEAENRELRAEVELLRSQISDLRRTAGQLRRHNETYRSLRQTEQAVEASAAGILEAQSKIHPRSK